MTPVSLRVRLLVGLCAIAAVLGATAIGSAAPAGAAAGVMRIGRAPLLPAGATLIQALAGSTPMHVTMALKPRDPAALGRFAREVSQPGSALYRHYLTPAQFGRRFGATAAAIAAVRASLRAHGLVPGPTSVNRLSIPVSTTAGTLTRAFAVVFSRMRLANGATATFNSVAPAVDRSIAGAVQGVVGLNSLGAPHPLRQQSALVRPQLTGPRVSAQSRAHVATGGPQPCASASGSGSAQSAYTADQIASAYDFSGLYRAGDQGQGVTVAIYELEPFDPQDIASFQSCYGTTAAISSVPVDGGSGSGGGSGESALDIEQLVGLAPKANFIVYEGPNSNSGAPGAGPYDTLAAIINQDRANVVSVSWGQCEALEGAADAQAEATLFEQAAVQGQSIVSAAGDAGSEDCDTGSLLPNTSLAVDDPGSQPFVTSVGGTSMEALGPPPIERVWNNGGNVQGFLGLSPGAGGGGVSSLWPMPAYQSGASPSLGVIGSGSSSSSCGASSGYCREVPDVSANADPFTGYLVYYNGAGSNSRAPAGWQGTGGTSAAAPVWAALIALADASRGCGGAPVGFVNPALYRAAASGYAKYFHDVTVGSNDLTASHGGLYPARPGYDMASGLGTPDAAALAAGLCAASLRLKNPGTLRSTVRSAVTVQLTASDAPGARVSYAATGLPPGLRLGASTGTISGRPSRTGSYQVRVLVSDSGGAVEATAFSWNIAGTPKLSGASLRSGAGGALQLGFKLAAARNAPSLSGLVITLPSGLRFAKRVRGLTLSGAGGARVSFSSNVASGALTIRLRQASPQVSVSAGAGSIVATVTLANQLRRGRGPRLSLDVTTTDTAGGVTALATALRRG